VPRSPAHWRYGWPVPGIAGSCIPTAARSPASWRSGVWSGREGARLLLGVGGGGVFGRVAFGAPLPAPVDAALAFNPIRNAPADLYPTGVIHRTRALAYPLSQRWRHAV
jgi:hypothetical protein